MKKNNNSIKVSKGYRLRLSTHSLIKNLQVITSLSSDQVLSKSCMMYYKTILEQTNIEKTNNNK
jgi:hypothetical protein